MQEPRKVSSSPPRFRPGPRVISGVDKLDRLLIIGASGLVGSRLLKLSESRFEVFGTYLSHPLTGPNLFPLDTRDRSSVMKLIEKVKPDFVVDTHSLGNVDYCE